MHLFYEAFGQLNAARSNAVLILHGLGANGHLASGSHNPEPGWWEDVVGPGLGVDTNNWFVVAPNVLGGSHGSTGPTSIAPNGRPWGSNFPALTIRDQVAAVVRLGSLLGVTRWAAVIGASLGGMHAIEWHIGHQTTVERVAVIAAPWAASAKQIMQNQLQIEIVRFDPDFFDGRYAEYGRSPRRGLALARQVGMLDYRTDKELDDRFGHRLQAKEHGLFAVESYFQANAGRFSEHFDANSFIVLVSAKNTHDIGRDRKSAQHALRASPNPLLVVGFDSDRLFPVEQQRFIAMNSPGSVSGSLPIVVTSEHGHDTFLVDQARIGALLKSFLQGGDVDPGEALPKMSDQDAIGSRSSTSPATR